jgi:hypothetical protein
MDGKIAHVCASFGLSSRKGQNMSSIIDHVTLGVSDLETALHVYDRVLPALGFQRLYHKPPFIG